MTHEEIKEFLSAYSDGQLDAGKMAEISGHLTGCEECRAALAGLAALSTGIKTQLSAAAPARMKERLLKKAEAEKIPLFSASTALATAIVVILLALMAGVAAKKYMPTMFASVQSMINGAAGTLGAGEGNK